MMIGWLDDWMVDECNNEMMEVVSFRRVEWLKSEKIGMERGLSGLN